MMLIGDYSYEASLILEMPLFIFEQNHTQCRPLCTDLPHRPTVLLTDLANIFFLEYDYFREAYEPVQASAGKEVPA